MGNSPLFHFLGEQLSGEQLSGEQLSEHLNILAMLSELCQSLQSVYPNFHEELLLSLLGKPVPVEIDNHRDSFVDFTDFCDLFYGFT